MNDINIIIIPNEILIFFHKLGDLMRGPILKPIYPKKKKNKKLELIAPNKKEKTSMRRRNTAYTCTGMGGGGKNLGNREGAVNGNQTE